LSDEARAAYLAEACGEDASLRARVDAMLRSAEQASEYFDDLEGSVVSQNARLAEGPGTIIGRYKLLQRIGEGGIGVLYLAEQRDLILVPKTARPDALLVSSLHTPMPGGYIPNCE